jgi:hypothetical protein
MTSIKSTISTNNTINAQVNASGSIIATNLAAKGGLASPNASDLGLGNVTNESKATMFTDSSFTGITSVEALNSSGNVGIGTSSPSTTLHLKGTGTIGQNPANFANATLRIENVDSGVEANLYIDGNEIVGDNNLYLQTTKDDGFVSLAADNSSGTRVNIANASATGFAIGKGTGAATKPLDVTGDVIFRGGSNVLDNLSPLIIFDKPAANDGIQQTRLTIGSTNTTAPFQIQTYTNNNVFVSTDYSIEKGIGSGASKHEFRIGNVNQLVLTGTEATFAGGVNVSGNVGIGTETPASLLHIKQSGHTHTDGIKIENSSGNTFSILSNSSGGLVFNNATTPTGTITNRFTITESGNVGIGTDPAYTLDVLGSINSSTSITASGLTISGNASVVTGNFTVNTDALHVRSSDNLVGIGTTTPNSLLTIDCNSVPTGKQRGITFDRSVPTTDGTVIGSFIWNNTANADTNDNTSVQIAKMRAVVETTDSNAGDDSGGHLEFHTKENEGALTQRLIIRSNGKVGIGTPSPSEALEVNGNIVAVDATLSGNLTVNGTTTTINSTTLQVDDKNIELGTVDTPTDTTADGGGITLKGTTDKTFNWINSTDSWTSSENIDLASGKTYKIGGTNIFTSPTIDNPNVTGKITLTRSGSTYENAPEVRLVDSDGTNQIGTISMSDGNLIIVSRNNTSKGIISFLQDDGTTRTDAFKVGSGGNFGINTASPQEKFHLVGTGRVDGDFLVDSSDNTFAVKSSTSNVGIGTSTPPASFKLVVAGDSRFTGSGIFAASSTGGQKALKKQYCFNQTGGFILQRGNTDNDSIIFKYDSSTSNTLRIFQKVSNAAGTELQFANKYLVVKGTQGMQIGTTGQAGTLSFKGAERQSTQGLRFFHTGIPTESLNFGAHGGYSTGRRWRFTHYDSTSGGSTTELFSVESVSTRKAYGSSSGAGVGSIDFKARALFGAATTLKYTTTEKPCAEFGPTESGDNNSVIHIKGRVSTSTQTIKFMGMQNGPEHASIKSTSESNGVGDLQFLTDDGTTHSTKMTIDKNGRVDFNVAKVIVRNDSNSGAAVIHSDDVTLVIGGGNNVSDGSNQGSAEGANIELKHGADGSNPGAIFYDATKHTFRANDASSTQMVIATDGKVGIGTTSPDTLLEVVGADPILTIRDTEISNASTSSILRLAESGGSDSLHHYRDLKFGADGKFSIGFNNQGSTNEEQLVIDSSGNVGIGTTSPNVTLHVKKTAAGQLDRLIRLQNNGTTSGTGSGIAFTHSTSSGFISAAIDSTRIDSNSASGNLIFSTRENSTGGDTSVTERMRIDSSGNVGIGKVATAGVKLDVEGDITSSGIIKGDRININSGKLYVDDSTTNHSVKIGAYGQGTFFGKDGSVNGAQYTLAVGSAGKIVEDLEVKTFKITGDGFLNLHTSPRTLIASPGAGKAIICHHVSFYVDAGSVKGTGSGGFDTGAQNCYQVVQSANQTYTTSSVVYSQGGLPRNVLVGMSGDFIWTGEPEGDFRVIPDRALLLHSVAGNNITSANTAVKPNGDHYIKIRYQVVNISGDFQNIAGLTTISS